MTRTSRGYVRLRSKNPADAPLTVFSHYQSRQDLTDMIDGIRLTRERLVRQPAWQQFHPRELSPGPGVVSDRDFEAFLRKASSTSYHPSGTCRMGTDADAVVDSEGRLNRAPAGRWTISGAGDGNRTRMASLEGWSSTIELRPHQPPNA